MNDIIFRNCADYADEYKCSILRAFEILYSGDDSISDEEYEKIFDYVELNQDNF